jgi:N6-adenosine-specific RNA methylase IME4
MTILYISSLWVSCSSLNRWGYQCCGELLWIKTNQLQRLIRTGIHSFVPSLVTVTSNVLILLLL